MPSIFSSFSARFILSIASIRVFAFHNQFRNHGIIKWRNHITAVHMRVDAHSITTTWLVVQYLSRTRFKIIKRIFRIDTAFNRTTLENIRIAPVFFLQLVLFVNVSNPVLSLLPSPDVPPEF
jgi:hypothetical protein